MRVRYIAHHQNYIWYGQVSIPAVRVRYIMKWRILINGKHGVSIPAARVRYILSLNKIRKRYFCFNSRGAGKIHRPNCRKNRADLRPPLFSLPSFAFYYTTRLVFCLYSAQNPFIRHPFFRWLPARTSVLRRIFPRKVKRSAQTVAGTCQSPGCCGPPSRSGTKGRASPGRRPAENSRPSRSGRCP